MSEGLAVAAQHTDNSDVMVFHTKSKLTDVSWENADCNSGCSEEFCPILRTLIEMDGVAKMTVTAYSVAVQKAALFKWDDLAPRIMKLLLLWHDHCRLMRGEEPEQRTVRNQAASGAESSTLIVEPPAEYRMRPPEATSDSVGDSPVDAA